MKVAISFLLCCVLVVVAAIGLVKFDLLPDSVNSLLDSAATEISGSSAVQIPIFSERWGSDSGEDPVEGTEDVSLLLLEAIEAFRQEVAIRVEIPAGGESEEREYLTRLVEDSFTIVRREQPWLFWIGMDEYGMQWTRGTRSSAATLTVSLNYSRSQPEAQTMRSDMEGTVSRIVAEMPEGTYERLKYFHDWIVDNTTYDMRVAESSVRSGREYAFNIDGVFREGKAVCEGYAKAYKVLCDEAGIPCYIAFGVMDDESHAWNYVQVDGSWYMVDCTSDDPVSTRDMLRHEYFLKGSGGLADGRVIRDIYLEDGGIYPTISVTDYDTGEVVMSPQEQETFGTGEVYQIELQMYRVLQEGTPSVATGAEIGIVSATGDHTAYAYELTGTGPDDHRFEVDYEEGRLRVTGEALTAGSYEIHITIYGAQQPALTSVQFEVRH